MTITYDDDMISLLGRSFYRWEKRSQNEKQGSHKKRVGLMSSTPSFSVKFFESQRRCLMKERSLFPKIH